MQLMEPAELTQLLHDTVRDAVRDVIKDEIEPLKRELAELQTRISGLEEDEDDNQRLCKDNPRASSELREMRRASRLRQQDITRLFEGAVRGCVEATTELELSEALEALPVRRDAEAFFESLPVSNMDAPPGSYLLQLKAMDLQDAVKKADELGGYGQNILDGWERDFEIRRQIVGEQIEAQALPPPPPSPPPARLMSRIDRLAMFRISSEEAPRLRGSKPSAIRADPLH